ARLNHLTQRANELSKIDPSAIVADRVGFGSKVTLQDTKTGDVVEYTLVFGDFIDLDSNQISIASPIGRALLGRGEGGEVFDDLPRGDGPHRITDLVTLPRMLES